LTKDSLTTDYGFKNVDFHHTLLSRTIDCKN